MLKTLLDKIKSGELPISKDAMLILLLGGILIYVIMLPTSKPSSSLMGNEVAAPFTFDEDDKGDYKNRMERELEDFLSEIEGVGRVKALIYLSDEDATSFYKNEVHKISGVVIGAEGAANATVRAQIIHLAMVLFGLDIDNVEVFVLKQ